ncbi:MAG: ABC transporter permease [Euryarchaeota archaeon]|nr:ABC transporter permease [Euryarchaeota archaeon]
MKTLTITKWEFKGTISSRKFLMIFFLQLAVLVLMIMFFNQFIANIESQKTVSLSPSLYGFASMDIMDDSKLITPNIDHELLEIRTLDYNESINRLKRGEITAFVIVPGDSRNKIDKIQVITINILVNYNDPKRSVVIEEVNSAAKQASSSISNQWIDSLLPEDKTAEPVVSQKGRGEPLPFQIIRKVMIAILLFLPLFLFGNMVIDSVVGEKERKTGEILIAMPLSHTHIIIGKSLAVVLTIAVQVAMWIIILIAAGFEIQNPILVYLIIILTAVPIIAITTIIAAYSKNYKEAGIGISFAYIGIVGFLIVPALGYISGRSTVSNISSMTLVMRIFSGENVPLLEFLLPIIFILIVSLISFWISIKLLRRDDVFFGPRPGILRLLIEFLGFKKVYRIK